MVKLKDEMKVKMLWAIHLNVKYQG